MDREEQVEDSNLKGMLNLTIATTQEMKISHSIEVWKYFETKCKYSYFDILPCCFYFFNIRNTRQ